MRTAHVGDFQCGIHQCSQLVQIYRLLDEVEGAGLQRADRRVHAAEGGDHRHGQTGLLMGDEIDQLYAVAVGEIHVGQAEVELLLCQVTSRGRQILGGGRLDAHSPQGDLEKFANVWFVVDDECTFVARHFGLSLCRDSIGMREGDPEAAASVGVSRVG